MPRFTLKDGKLSSEVYIQVTRDHQCACGRHFVITLNWPEGLSSNSKISIDNCVCPACEQPVIIPEGHHYVEDFKLLTKPIVK